MAIETCISEDAYVDIALAEPDRKWELHDGRLREKPGMTWAHNRIVMLLNRQLLAQVDLDLIYIFTEGRVRRPPGTIYVPDLLIVPIAYGQEIEDRPGVLSIFSGPLPLVVEVWSTSTGDYDVDTKIPEYQRRGDLEIWRIHPYEQTLTAWIRQLDGTYSEAVYRSGTIHLSALPEVVIDLDELFGR
jgi:Uma2 family endonuclease